jgi:DNA processing protein
MTTSTLPRPTLLCLDSPFSEYRRTLLGDPLYPESLASSPHPLPSLYYRGSLESLTRPTVAIVGSRACSASGEARASRLAGEMAQAGVCVVSGLARGIDGAAHRGALAAGGLTVAVLGSGLWHVYPYEHRELSLQVQASGAVVSQFDLGFTGSAWSFKKRNHLVAALSQLVIVVEARLHSGTAHTIKQALAQGRKVGLLRSLVESEGWAAQLAEHHQVFTVRETGCILERLVA